LYCSHHLGVYRIIRHIDTYQPPCLPSCPDKTLPILSQLSQYHLKDVEIYTDGSWTRHLSPNERLFGGNGHIHSGAAIVVVPRTEDHRTCVKYAIPINDISSLYPTSVYTAESYAILLANLVRHHLSIPCTIHTDSANCINQLTSKNRLRKSYKPAIQFAIQASASLSQLSPTILQKAPSHAERHQPNKLLWSRGQYLNYIADGIASLNHDKWNALTQWDTEIRILDPISSIDLESMYIQTIPYVITCRGRPLAETLTSSMNHAYSWNYLNKREMYSSKNRWLSYSLSFTSQAWDLKRANWIQRIRRLRIIYNKNITEYNTHRFNMHRHSPHLPTQCLFCGKNPTEAHLACDCLHPTPVEIRQMLTDTNDNLYNSISPDQTATYNAVGRLLHHFNPLQHYDVWTAR
jgi:hypothetical protein